MVVWIRWLLFKFSILGVLSPTLEHQPKRFLSFSTTVAFVWIHSINRLPINSPSLRRRISILGIVWPYVRNMTRSMRWLTVANVYVRIVRSKREWTTRNYSVEMLAVKSVRAIISIRVEVERIWLSIRCTYRNRSVDMVRKQISSCCMSPSVHIVRSFRFGQVSKWLRMKNSASTVTSRLRPIRWLRHSRTVNQSMELWPASTIWSKFKIFYRTRFCIRGLCSNFLSFTKSNSSMIHDTTGLIELLSRHLTRQYPNVSWSNARRCQRLSIGAVSPFNT